MNDDVSVDVGDDDDELNHVCGTVGTEERVTRWVLIVVVVNAGECVGKGMVDVGV